MKGRPHDEHIDLGVFRHLEFTTIAEDLKKAQLQPGKGTLPIDGDKVLYFHETRLSDGSLFDIRECRKLFTSLIIGAPNNLSYYEKALSTMYEGEEAMFLVGPNQHWNEYFKQNQSLAYEHNTPQLHDKTIWLKLKVHSFRRFIRDKHPDTIEGRQAFVHEAKDWARLALNEGKKKDAARIYTKVMGALKNMSR